MEGGGGRTEYAVAVSVVVGEDDAEDADVAVAEDGAEEAEVFGVGLAFGDLAPAEAAGGAPFVAEGEGEGGRAGGGAGVGAGEAPDLDT